jgi:hypothetical protein
MYLLRASRLGPLPAPLLALAAAVAFAGGCGDDSGEGSLLSQRQASELRGTLNEVEQDVAAENCSGAAEQVAALESQIDSIRRLDRDLRRALRSSARRLETLVSDTCETETTPSVGTTETTTTPEEGTTGATGAEGEKKPKENKKPKKEKPPKTPPGQGEETPPDEGNGGGGAGVPGESDSDADGG